MPHLHTDGQTSRKQMPLGPSTGWAHAWKFDFCWLQKWKVCRKKEIIVRKKMSLKLRIFLKDKNVKPLKLRIFLKAEYCFERTKRVYCELNLEMIKQHLLAAVTHRRWCVRRWGWGWRWEKEIWTWRWWDSGRRSGYRRQWPEWRWWESARSIGSSRRRSTCESQSRNR